MADKPIIHVYKTPTLNGYVWQWVVMCDPYDQRRGTADTKKEAKKTAGDVVCSMGGGTGGGVGTGSGDGNQWSYVGDDGKTYLITIEPPKVNASMTDSHLEYFEMINPWTEELHRFTLDDISWNELAWYTGLCIYDKNLSQKLELVVAALKIWHVYLGGNSLAEVMSLHNLNDVFFEKIASKSWEGITICKKINEDGTIYLDWTIES